MGRAFAGHFNPIPLEPFELAVARGELPSTPLAKIPLTASMSSFASNAHSWGSVIHSILNDCPDQERGFRPEASAPSLGVTRF